MSIHFSFTMKPKKRLFKKEELDFLKVSEAMKKLEKEEQIGVKVSEDKIWAELCPEGYLRFVWKKEENKVTGDCQTNVAGPGFHAEALALVERAAKDLDMKLTVNDETGYARHKDFEKMRREYFYPWLKYILSLVCGQFSKTDYELCWDLESYWPKIITGTVITPIRRFTIEEMKRYQAGEMEDFAKDFFVWNSQKKDAWFYRNAALLRMNTACYFMFSERNIKDGIENGMCLHMLEKALQYDRAIPFPKEEYRLLSRLHGQESMNLDGVTDLRHRCEIGYRRQEVYHRLGYFTYPIYGNCLERRARGEKNSMFYYDDEAGHWHNIRVTLFQYGTRNAEYAADMFEGDQVETVQDFRAGEAFCRLATIKPTELPNSPEGLCYEMTAQYVLDNQLLLVTQTYCRSQERSAIIDWFKRIQGLRRASLRTSIKAEPMEEDSLLGDS